MLKNTSPLLSHPLSLILLASATAFACATAGNDGETVAGGTTTSGGTTTGGDGSGGTTFGTSTGTTTSGDGTTTGTTTSGGTTTGTTTSGGTTTGTTSGGDGMGGETSVAVPTGACADYADLGAGHMTGDFAVYSCTKVQGGCTTAGEPSVFQCTDTHVDNCNSQDPTGGSSWTFVALCSELGMGGASGN